ncbi:MAG TPA: adenylosuccinate lyase [bacterium]|nr:adenylosuccinate lyase [bacterium]HQL61488.1 adenylosuccinate lyase [bacterium]
MIERYTRPQMGAIWSEENKYRTWLRVEIAACRAMCRLGKVPPDALREIEEKADFDIPRIRELEKTLDHETIAFLTAVGEKVGPASRFIHLGLTSSDKLDTAGALQLVQSLDLIAEDLQKLRQAVGGRAVQHKHTVMIGRTHGVHAEPITFGLKLAIWYDELRRHVIRLGNVRRNIGVGKISGAVGTYSHVQPEVEYMVCKDLGLEPAPVSNQIIQRDRHAEYLNALALLGCTLEKMAFEIRGLQKTEVHEVEEPFPKGQKGSSSMPHKKNPNLSERITGLARLLRGYAQVGMENVALWHERDISHSSNERVTLADASILVDYLLDRMTWIITDMRVFPERMKKNLDLTGGLIFSQKVLLALTQAGMSREEAYAIVQESSMRVWEEGGHLRDLLKDHPKVKEVLSEKQLEECFGLGNLLEMVDLIFERIGLV